ncbi:sugar O-acetyltransferase [Verrucomicrobiaceae bacterium 227]
MLSGQAYQASDPVLAAERARARRVFHEFNQDPTREHLAGLLGSCPKEITIEPNFRCDYGYNIHVGENFYANFDLVILDVCEVRIGKNCLIGPQVGIYAATHPLDVKERRAGWESGAPITLGDDVWLGGHCVINPGVTLGNNVVVASGAVVTKSFPDNCVIGGVPARILEHLKP